MKKAMKILLIFLLVIVVLLAVFIAVSALKKKRHEAEPWYTDNYYEMNHAVGILEKEYSKQGSFEVEAKELEMRTSDAFTFKVWYPQELHSTKETYPMVVVVNASGIAYINFEPYFRQLASYGFVVIGNSDRESASGKSGIDSLNYMLALNNDSDSIFYGKIDLEHIGIEGASQGGVGAYNAATAYDESEIFVSLFTQSAASLEAGKGRGWTYDLSKVHMPCMMLASTGSFDSMIINQEQLTQNFNTVNSGCYTAMGRITGIDHENMLEEADPYRIAWFLWTLKGDEKAATVFIGDTPEIVSNERYVDVQIKNNY